MRKLYDWIFRFKKIKYKYKKIYKFIIIFMLNGYYKDINRAINKNCNIENIIRETKKMYSVLNIKTIYDGEVKIELNIHKTIKFIFRDYINIEINIHDKYLLVKYYDAINLVRKEFYYNSKRNTVLFTKKIDDFLIKGLRVYYKNIINII